MWHERKAIVDQTCRKPLQETLSCRRVLDRQMEAESVPLAHDVHVLVGAFGCAAELEAKD